jgi:hypothetical protein
VTELPDGSEVSDEGIVLRQAPAVIARDRQALRDTVVSDATSVELAQELIGRATAERKDMSDAARAFRDGGSPEQAEPYDAAARDLSLAITHLEDARTRINAAHYRSTGKFSISDAERR